MPEQQHSDGGIQDGIERSDLRWILSATMSAQDDLASAANQGVSFVDTRHPGPDIRRVHTELLDAYGEICTAIDAAENTIRTSDWDYETPSQIKKEHADRIEETYDLPLVYLALMLLEQNRREWLHQKPDSGGAKEVRRHGLTGTQRNLLNQLQDWSDAAGAVEDTIPTLRGQAEELREREDFDEHLQAVAEQLEHRADRLEAQIGGESDGE